MIETFLFPLDLRKQVWELLESSTALARDDETPGMVMDYQSFVRSELVDCLFSHGNGQLAVGPAPCLLSTGGPSGQEMFLLYADVAMNVHS